MRRVLPLLAIVCLAFAPAPFPKAERPPDAQKMRGKWARVRLYNGTALVPEEPGEVTVVIDGGIVAFCRGGQVHTRWMLVLDARQSPRSLDLVGLDENKGYVLHGIYRLEADVFTCCYSGTVRPASFDPAPGAYLIVLERVKP
jgi:uncharacterized protein (TIGR03067 family)